MLYVKHFYPISTFRKCVTRWTACIFWIAMKSTRYDPSFNPCFIQYHLTAKRNRRFLVRVKVSTALPWLSPVRYLTSKNTVIPSFFATISISPHFDATKLVSKISYLCLWRYWMAMSSARSPVLRFEFGIVIEEKRNKTKNRLIVIPVKTGIYQVSHA